MIEVQHLVILTSPSNPRSINTAWSGSLSIAPNVWLSVSSAVDSLTETQLGAPAVWAAFDSTLTRIAKEVNTRLEVRKKQENGLSLPRLQ